MCLKECLSNPTVPDSRLLDLRPTSGANDAEGLAEGRVVAGLLGKALWLRR